MAKKNDRLTKTRIISLEVTGDYSEHADSWHALARECQGLANAFWQCWVSWHFQNNSYDKLRRWLDMRANDGEQKAGKCPVDAIPKSLEKELHALRWRFPMIPSRISTLLPQRLKRTMQSRKASKGSLPGYSAILLHHETHPTFTGPYPILLDRANTTFEPPAKRGGNWHLLIKMIRVDNGEQQGVEETHRLEIWCKGQKVRSQVAILERIVQGDMAIRAADNAITNEYGSRLAALEKGTPAHATLRKEKNAKATLLRNAVKAEHHVFAGSQLHYCRSKRKWFVKLCYVSPQEDAPNLDSNRIAVLSARDDGPWLLALPDGKTRRPGGHGRYIGAIRHKLLVQRWDRRENYKYAGSANKGHGRTRAGAGPLWKLQQVWKNLVKRVNSGVVREVLNACVAADCGTLIYEQPDGEFCDTRFLATSGKVTKPCECAKRSGETAHCKRCNGKGKIQRTDSSGWKWFQVRTMLEQRSIDCGVSVETRKVEGSSDEKNPGSPRHDVSDDANERCGNKQAEESKRTPQKGRGKQERSKRSPKRRGGK